MERPYRSKAGVAGAAIAVGPVIGGFVTTYYSWRYVFVGEVLFGVVIYFLTRRMNDTPAEAGVELNRKMLADLATHEPEAFAQLCARARDARQAASAS